MGGARLASVRAVHRGAASSRSRRAHAAARLAVQRVHAREDVSVEEALEVVGLSRRRRHLARAPHLRRMFADVPLVPDDTPLRVLFEDDRLLAVAKPGGVRVHPAHSRFERGSLLCRALHHVGGAARGAEPRVVHRLDEGTSGVVVFAKDAKAAASLADQFARRTVRKEYVCLSKAGVRPLIGGGDGDAFTVDAPLSRHPASSPASFVDPEGGRPAVTAFRVLATSGNSCLLLARPLTGRTHQIRAHARHVGLPLVGDTLYGGDDGLMPRQALHAARLTVAHPDDGRELALTAALPADFVAAVERTGLGGALGPSGTLPGGLLG